jgi:putative membrane protein insertion efficiency factor
VTVAARALVLVYRYVLRPLWPGGGAVGVRTCMYEPTCSAYAVEAVRLHGAVRGSALAVRRVCRCHPWSHGGFDPVRPR